MTRRVEVDAPALGAGLREAEPVTFPAADLPAGGLMRRVQAVAEQVAGLRLAVVGLAEAHRATRAAQADIALAVTEACTNVVMHAYVDAAEAGPLTLEAYHDDGALFVIVTDEGRGMIPRPDSPGLGVGLSLIARLAERLEISDHAPSGTKLEMTFAVAAAT